MPKEGYSNTGLVVGLTGGIGSGKSTCAKVFEVLGVPIYNADERAKALYTENENLKQDVIDLLGPEAFAGGTLNRAFVAKSVFENADLLRALEKIVHPRVREDFETWKPQCISSPYVIREAAILIESGGHKDCDYIVNVVAEISERIKRVIKRDGSSKDQVEKRIAKQLSDDQRAVYSQFTIRTDSDQFVITQVEDIHRSILSKV